MRTGQPRVLPESSCRSSGALRCFVRVLGPLAGAAASAQDGAPPRVEVVYFGTSCCPVCAGWKRFDYPKLARSPAFLQVHFTEDATASCARLSCESVDIDGETVASRRIEADRVHLGH